MYKLLSVNGCRLPNPEGSYEISREDKYNEYEAEDGSKTVEVIRQDVISLSASYTGLTEKQLKSIMDSLQLVSSVCAYDPARQTTRTFNAKVTGIKSGKVWYRNNISMWSLSFNIEEL